MTSSVFQLQQGRVFGFDGDSKSTVWCLGGELWVTGPGLGDRVLVAGETAETASRGRIVVEALSPAQLRVSVS